MFYLLLNFMYRPQLSFKALLMLVHVAIFSLVLHLLLNFFFLKKIGAGGWDVREIETDAENSRKAQITLERNNYLSQLCLPPTDTKKVLEKHSAGFSLVFL